MSLGAGAETHFCVGYGWNEPFSKLQFSPLHSTDPGSCKYQQNAILGKHQTQLSSPSIPGKIWVQNPGSQTRLSNCHIQLYIFLRMKIMLFFHVFILHIEIYIYRYSAYICFGNKNLRTIFFFLYSALQLRHREMQLIYTDCPLISFGRYYHLSNVNIFVVLIIGRKTIKQNMS